MLNTCKQIMYGSYKCSCEEQVNNIYFLMFEIALHLTYEGKITPLQCVIFHSEIEEWKTKKMGELKYEICYRLLQDAQSDMDAKGA